MAIGMTLILVIQRPQVYSLSTIPSKTIPSFPFRPTTTTKTKTTTTTATVTSLFSSSSNSNSATSQQELSVPTEMIQTDSVICGGGPAGLLTAIMLAQKFPFQHVREKEVEGEGEEEEEAKKRIALIQAIQDIYPTLSISFQDEGKSISTIISLNEIFKSVAIIVHEKTQNVNKNENENISRNEDESVNEIENKHKMNEISNKLKFDAEQDKLMNKIKEINDVNSVLNNEIIELKEIIIKHEEEEQEWIEERNHWEEENNLRDR